MIQKATPKDFNKVFVLLQQLWPHEKFSKPKVRKIYLDDLKSKNSIQLVLENKGIIGYSSVQFRNDIQSQGKIGYLSELILDESHRGKGLGKKLLLETMKQAKKHGCLELQFPSTFKRKKAHKFYESLGYKKTAYFFWKEL